MSLQPEQVWGAADYAPTAERLSPVAPVVAEVLSHAAPPPAMVLEIGAGHGELAALLADAGYEVVAIEPTPRMREIGQARTPSTATWIAAPAESTGLPDASQDAAVSAFGLMFADPDAGIGETARVLRHGGVLVMTAWAPRGFLHEMTGRMVAVLPHLATAPHLSWGDPDTARGRLEPHFDVIDIEERTLPWTFDSVDEGMHLYQHGSPSHAASFAMAGERRGELELALRQHLEESASADGTVSATANYVVISARRT